MTGNHPSVPLSNSRPRSSEASFSISSSQSSGSPAGRSIARNSSECLPFQIDKVQILLTDQIAVVENIFHFISIDQQQAVARFNAVFFGDRTGRYLTDLM